MRFTPKTEEELRASLLLPEGIYNYKVIKAEDKISAAGNEYISLVLQVWDSEGHESAVFTNLSLIKLLKHLCDVNNMQLDYKGGDIPASKFMNKCEGKVVLGVEPEKPNGSGGYYPPKNIVKDYVPAPIPSKLNPLGDISSLDAQDIPF